MIELGHVVLLRKQEPRAASGSFATLGSCFRRSTGLFSADGRAA